MLLDMMMLMKKVPVTYTYATWNPSDKSTYITLSNGNLTTTSASSPNYASVRSTISKSSGKWYWEMTVGSPASSQGAGVATSTFPNDNVLVGNSAAYGPTSGYSWVGYIITNATGTAVPTCAIGDIIGIALDADAGTTKFYKNGVLISTETHGTGDLFAVQSTFQSVNTTNFGATPFSYSPPAGHNSGLYV